MAKRNQPGCPCCGGGCVGTVTADSTCNGAAIAGATYKIIASDGVTVVATLTGGTSVVFSGLTGATDYYVEVSKTGYHTKRSALFTLGCAASVSKTVPTWPTTYTVAIHVRILAGGVDCPLSGVSVSVTGDGSGSGSTDGSGDVSLSISSSSSSESQSLTYSFTPPSGHGAETKSVSVTVHACSGDSRTVTLNPAAGHVAVICNSRYMPEDMTWDDDYGSCTVTFSSGAWYGSYTYTSTHCIQDTTCSGTPGPYPDQTSDVTVNVYINASEAGGAGDCGATDWDVGRQVALGDQNICGSLLTYRCQPIADGCSILPPSGTLMTASATSTCGSSVSIDFAISALSASLCATYEETAVDINVSGTIS